MRLKLGALALAFGVALITSNIGAVSPGPQEDGAKPKNSIKDVMKKANKGDLLKTVLGGSASQEEKVELLDLYIDLLEGTPKKGERQAWIMAAGATVVAAGKVVAGRDGSLDELKIATNCKACHDVFK